MGVQDWSMLVDIVSAIGTLAAAGVAWKQLSKLNKSLNDSNLMAIFQIEFELNRRKERLAEIRNENESILLMYEEKEIDEKQKSEIKRLDSYRKEAYEDYLNVFDRLCYFILKKQLDEEDFRLEYREMLFNTIEQDKESTFSHCTKYRNMIKLYDSWKEK